MQLVNLHPPDRRRPSLLYLPGLDGTGKLFYRQRPGLAHYFNLLALRLTPGPLPDDWSAIASVLHQLIQQQWELTRPLYLCGESFGGCLALVYSCLYPQEVAKLILVNPATAFDRRPWLQWGIPLHQWLPNPLQTVTTLTGLPFLAAVERLQPQDRRQLLNAMRSIPPAIVAQRLTLLQNFNHQGLDLGTISAPSLILASQRDLLLPSVEEAHKLQAHLPKAMVKILPHSGHACLLEKELSLQRILQTAQWLPELILLNKNS
ncbi:MULTISPECIES: alpha/beta fold hydrolase [unclassified Synechocystis]|uniref:alpha/beta fold hydrolase n=1 Tax=unclassified Synechocystis TaxID=2640012 RepID=UPI0003FAA2C2|nr:MULTISPECIES: alpha/beta hydrolase [unclassified Synechocystis]AIE72562.1 hydrolase, alpha/beta fold family [Synechocystis sp. PCC 6714]MCT0254480.1 alpha/beta hydrolase [Synechocystis sp. CS-94]